MALVQVSFPIGIGGPVEAWYDRDERGGTNVREDVPESAEVSRRSVLGALGVLGVAVAGGALGRPVPAAAQALGQQETVAAALKRLFGTRPIADGAGRIKLDLPLIAENGAVVPVSVEVVSPMIPTNYVKHIYIVADKNRIPVITRATLTPEAGQAYIGENIRLGETGEVRAIAEQSDGTLLQVKREVKVTVGGCGG
jgi:sulfur-oxidizing protein SoxY